MSGEVNREIEKKNREFLHHLNLFIGNYDGELPDLRDIFQPKAIDWLLSDSIKNDIYGIWPRKLFIDFAVRAGYKDEPPLDEDGRPLLRRTTHIHRAAKCDTRDTDVRRLFEIYNRFDVNYTDESGLTHYQVACRFALKDVVEKFLEFGQDPNCLAPETGESPLYLALAAENKDLVGLLLRNGANPDLPNKKGSTPLHLICRSRYQDLVEMFLEMCDELNQPLRIDAQNDCGDTPLHFAVEFDNLEATEWLLRHGANPNLANTSGKTPLHVMHRKCQDDKLVKLFFSIIEETQQSVQVDARDILGNTPLHLAVAYNRRTMTEWLLTRGANPNLGNAEGLTPLHIICKSHDDVGYLAKMLFRISDEKRKSVQIDAQEKLGRTPLHLALLCGNDKLAELLLRRGASPDLADLIGLTALHFCNHFNNYRLVEILFEISEEKHRKLEVNAQDNEGNTPLHSFIYNGGSKEAIESLLRHGANPNMPNHEGWTPLHLVCRKKDDYTSVETFFKMCDENNRQVEVDARNKQGWTPLQLAVANLKFDVIDVLLDRGADLSSFVFPTENHFVKIFNPNFNYDGQGKLRLMAQTLKVVECLETKGYELKRSDALTIIKIFAMHGMFQKSPDPKKDHRRSYHTDIDSVLQRVLIQLSYYENIPLDRRREEYDKSWIHSRDFERIAKKLMVSPSLSLYDLTRLQPEEASKLLTYTDYYDFARSGKLKELLNGQGEHCAIHLCEKLSRLFFRCWALDSFMRLSGLPFECCLLIIDESLMNKDLYNICFRQKL